MEIKNIQNVRLNGKDATTFDVYIDGVKQNSLSVLGTWKRASTIVKKCLSKTLAGKPMAV